MRFRPLFALVVFSLIALGAFWARGRAAAVEERDLVPLDVPGIAPVEQAAAAPADQPADEDEPRSPIVKALLGALDSLEGEGTEEERRQIHQILMGADDELADSLGENSLHAILDANNRHQGLDLRRANLRQRPQADLECCDSGSEQNADVPQLRRYRHYQEFGTPPDLD